VNRNSGARCWSPKAFAGLRFTRALAFLEGPANHPLSFRVLAHSRVRVRRNELSVSQNQGICIVETGALERVLRATVGYLMPSWAYLSCASLTLRPGRILDDLAKVPEANSRCCGLPENHQDGKGVSEMQDWRYLDPKKFHRMHKFRNKILRQFLEYFMSLKTVDEKLSALREIAGMKFLSTTREWLVERRYKFDKHKNWKLSLNADCAVCHKKAQLRHHIVQLQNGGTNGHQNLIPLCNMCHEEVHPWMKGRI
jgi:hypothetical protein